MAAGQAEFIYVGGPQGGQRASLTSAVVTVGRGQQADVQLTEEHVSRKHFQLTFTQDGWVFENLSPLKSRVNGKKYKVGKKIILDTGDVIEVGGETELLFVASGDDPEAALIAYRQSGAKKGKPRAASAKPVAATPPKGPDPQVEALEQIEGASRSDESEEEEEVELTDEELAAEAQKAKFKKYATVFGAYIGLLLVVVVILFSMRRPASHTTGPDGRPVLLNNQQIDDFINAPLNRDRNAVEARSALEKAILVLERTNKIDHQYKAVYWFKVARAYGRVLNSEEEQKYSEASRRLTKQVQDMYRNAYAYQKDHQYVTSERIFRNLLEMLPSMERRDGNSELRENIIAHVANITRLSAANNRR
ncbi:MAG: FHA domain-containing protein [Phycisphaerae bacterium]|jgi:pSer/pThr/pTyr-binding forkhead associated (FHA) protein|nr:FHA domain-containing protein [Phycisphaerae bacterium]